MWSSKVYLMEWIVSVLGLSNIIMVKIKIYLEREREEKDKERSSQ